MASSTATARSAAQALPERVCGLHFFQQLLGVPACLRRRPILQQCSQSRPGQFPQLSQFVHGFLPVLELIAIECGDQSVQLLLRRRSRRTQPLP